MKLIGIDERKDRICCICETNKSVKYESNQGWNYCNKCVLKIGFEREFEEENKN